MQKYRHLENPDVLYNREPTKKSLLLTNEWHRSLRGIILARLAQRGDWVQLVATYRSQLIRRGTPEPFVHRYARLADYLRIFW